MQNTALGNYTEQIEKLPQVESRTGKAKSAIYAGVKNGTFPAPIKLGPRAVGWLKSEIDAWISDRIRDSRKGR